MLLIKQNLNQITKGFITQKEYPCLPYFTSIKDKPKDPLTLILMVINLAHWWVEKGQEPTAQRRAASKHIFPKSSFSRNFSIGGL